MGADGRALSQCARARNISAGGALLCGIEHELKIGDKIGVKAGEKKARCKIVWAMKTGSVRNIQVGVQLVSRLGRRNGTELPQRRSRYLKSRLRNGCSPVNVARAPHSENSTSVPMHVPK